MQGLSLLLMLLVLPPSQASVVSLNQCYDPFVSGLQSTQHRGDVESILQAEPSVVLANPFNNPLLVQALKRHGVPVKVLPEPNSLAELDAFWAQFSRLTQASRFTTHQLREMKSLRGKRVLLLQANHYSFGADTLWHEIMQALGADNLAAKQGSGLVTVLPEQVLLWQPEVIFVQRQPDFALASLNMLHGALGPLLESRAVELEGRFMGCLAQQMPGFIAFLEEHFSDLE